MKYLFARLKEPSTYAAMAALMAMFGLNMDPGMMQAVASFGAAAAGLAGVFMKG